MIFVPTSERTSCDQLRGVHAYADFYLGMEKAGR
jgi:hypothetical protein